MTTSSNTGYICSECSAERLKSWQEHHQDTIVTTGDFVKVRVMHAGGDQEWMWAEVVFADTTINGEIKLNCWFRNDALLSAHPSYGDRTTILRTDIADYCKQGDFDDWKPWHPGHIDHSRHQIN